jgi:hypothetical protein
MEIRFVMEIRFLERDHISADAKTNYWFCVNNEDVYAVSVGAGVTSLLDCDGCPIEPCNDHDNILEALMPHYKKHIND